MNAHVKCQTNHFISEGLMKGRHRVSEGQGSSLQFIAFIGRRVAHYVAHWGLFLEPLFMSLLSCPLCTLYTYYSVSQFTGRLVSRAARLFVIGARSQDGGQAVCWCHWEICRGFKSPRKSISWHAGLLAAPPHRRSTSGAAVRCSVHLTDESGSGATRALSVRWGAPLLDGSLAWC